MQSTLEGVKVHYVDSVKASGELLEWLGGVVFTNTPVAVDTETWGLAWWGNDFTRLIQFGTRDEGWAVGAREWRTVAQQACQMLADAHCPVIFHNAPFDMHALEDDGFAVPAWDRVHDTKVLHHLLWPHYNHSLKPMSEAIWGPEATYGDKLMKARAAELGCKWWELPTDEPTYWAYGVLDTILTRRHYDDLYPQVRAQFSEQYDRELALQEIMYRAEKRGLRIDPQYTQRLLDEWTIEATALAEVLRDAGIENPNSERQVEAILRDLGWEPSDFTATGQAVLDKAIKQSLMREYPAVVEPLMRYQRITKWSTVYLRKFLSSKDTQDRVHAGINCLQARTGRMSITEPPLQTLPSGDPAIRTCVLAPEGHHLWAVDYQAQEARLFVNYSQDAALADVILSGHDLYTHFAQVVYGDPSITKDDPRRGMFKVMILAFFYGAGVDKLSLITGMPDGEVQDMLKRLFYEYPSIASLTGDYVIGGAESGIFARKARERLDEEGLAYVLTSGGRRFSMPAGEVYKAVNGVMQGSGKDVLANAVLRLDAAGLSDNIVLPVHDELLFAFPEGDTEGPAEAARLMEDHSFPVPLTTELSGPLLSWGAKYQ